MRPTKKETHNSSSNFSETEMIYQKKFTLLQNSVYPLSFDTEQLQDVLAMHDQARTISNDDVRIGLRRIGI